MGTEKSHQVFSLKYRPGTFEEMVGQRHVRLALVNSLRRRQIAHGYIFSGPRGVGKTTVARLFAKALNCQKGPGADICNTCDACREIATSRCLDVIEMDGASNRKIEDVRVLRENVRFAPTSGRYKIYIIDEVHMLTTEAFNALLKTLEEPPEHVVFILATTDPQKIPDTIHSRCQELEFHRISPADLSPLIERVCEKEGISVGSRDIIQKLAEWSDGSARDSLVWLEQAASFSDGKVITEEVVDSLFGWVDQKTVDEAIDAVMREDRKKICDFSIGLESAGKDLGHFFVQTARRIRSAWLSKLEGHPTDAPAALSECRPDTLFRMVSCLLESERNLRGIRQQGLYLTVKLMELIDIKNAVTLSQLVRRIDEVEARLSTAGTGEGSREGAVIPPATSAAGTTANCPMDIDKIWENLLARISADDVKVAAWLKEARPVSISAGDKRLTIHYAPKFKLHHQRITAERNRAAVETLLSEIVGDSGWRITAVMEDEAGTVPVVTDAKEVPSKVRAAADLFESKGVRKRE